MLVDLPLPNTKLLELPPSFASDELAGRPAEGVSPASPDVWEVPLGVGYIAEDLRRYHILAQLRQVGLDAF